MASRAKDWFEQAQRDLDHARNDAQYEYHEWACFSAQQASEKALKALFQSISAECRGHSIKSLLKLLPGNIKIDTELLDCARILDYFYIPTRYPNGFDDGKPADYFTDKESEQAISCAEKILRFCEYHISGS